MQVQQSVCVFFYKTLHSAAFSVVKHTKIARIGGKWQLFAKKWCILNVSQTRFQSNFYAVLRKYVALPTLYFALYSPFERV